MSSDEFLPFRMGSRLIPVISGKRMHGIEIAVIADQREPVFSGIDAVSAVFETIRSVIIFKMPVLA
jgi:hypothetical protein